jgi:hypothetical protein
MPCPGTMEGQCAGKQEGSKPAGPHARIQPHVWSGRDQVEATPTYPPPKARATPPFAPLLIIQAGLHVT